MGEPSKLFSVEELLKLKIAKQLEYGQHSVVEGYRMAEALLRERKEIKLEQLPEKVVVLARTLAVNLGTDLKKASGLFEDENDDKLPS